MSLRFTRLLGLTVLFVTFSTFPAFQALANDGDNDSQESFTCNDSTNVMECIEKTQAHGATVAGAPSSFYTQQGPLNVGVRYDTVLGWIPELSYTRTFSNNALFLELNYGANEHRANVTFGHGFNAHEQIKLTYEYLAQNLPFDFASGTTNQWVDQNAVGAGYRYLFTHQLLHSVDVNGYYIHANNKNLPNAIFYQGTDPYLNLRHIAGGTEETATTGVTLSPNKNVLINLGGGYSHLSYDTTYEDSHNTSAFAYNAGFDALITGHTKFSSGVVNSAAELDTSVKVSQIVTDNVEAAVTGQYSHGQAGQPNSTSVMLALAYPVTAYNITSDDCLSELKAWVQKPVVHASRVLAIKDEKVIKFTISATNPPAQSLMTGQMIQTLSTQNIFSFDPSLYDRVVYSMTLAPNPNTSNLGDPQNQLDIAIQQNDNYNATIFSTAPLPNAAAPNGEKTVYHLIVTAQGYKTGLVAPIQSTADVELDVNFNRGNEPQWNAKNAVINFDTVGATSGINLSKIISGNGEPMLVGFDDATKYPQWDVQEVAGTWYLFIKPSADGSFDANNITASKLITLTVQYADDPAVAVPTTQALNVKVNPDNQITYSWLNSAACKVSFSSASYPTNSAPAISQQILPCLIYKSNGQAIKVSNDNLSFTVSDKGGYSDGIGVTGTILSISSPTSGIGNTYSPIFEVQGKAQGGNAPLVATDLITVGDTLIVTKTNDPNYYNTFNDDEDGSTTFYFASFIVKRLDDQAVYQVISATGVSQVPPDLMISAPGAVANYDDYKISNHKQVSLNQNLSAPSGGVLSVMWYTTSSTYPTVTSFTLKRIK